MIGNVLNIKQLEALVWVTELGSFRKAAHHLNTTQPNISSRISRLETTLGVVLMERTGSIRLTDKGQEILTAARSVLRQAEQIVEIAGRPDLVEDRLRLGVTELVACTWLHAYLRRIKTEYPSLNIELTVDLSRNLDRELNANRLDLAVQTAPFGSAATGVVELGSIPYIWVAGKKIADALKGSLGVSDLLAHSLLTHDRNTQAYVQLVEHAAKNGVPSTGFVSSNSLSSCVQMAADDMGVTLLPKTLVEREIKQGRLFEIGVNWTPSPLRFSARYQSEKAAPFLNHAAELAADVVATYETFA